MPRGKSAGKLALIDTIRAILATIQPATVRGVCYQLFSRGLIPSMARPHTKMVSEQLVWAREQGIVPWGWIVDRSRNAIEPYQWDGISDFATWAVQTYARNHWQTQPKRVEVWSEKDTVGALVSQVTLPLGVTFSPFRGFNSATNVYTSAQDSVSTVQPLLALYIGDYDPSGMHMSEADLPTRLYRYGGDVEVRRIALDYNDVNSPALAGLSFPAADKVTDSRYQWFVDRYGPTCWELDAMNPNVLRARVQDAIRAEIDQDAWDASVETENDEREQLRDALRDADLLP